jgi:hypothetical protein
MRYRVAAVLPLVAFAFGCGDQTSPAAPDVSPNFVVAGASGIQLIDHCQPSSFNRELGPGTCVPRIVGGPSVSFTNFIHTLRKLHLVPSWEMTPGVLDVDEDETVDVHNIGGETHTFTEVEEFGGGIVPSLNALAGLTTVAPECAALTGADFIAAGSTVPHLFDDEAGEVEKYQCCIHPWMRQIVQVH